jgi:hypothetical protein
LTFVFSGQLGTVLEAANTLDEAAKTISEANNFLLIVIVDILLWDSCLNTQHITKVLQPITNLLYNMSTDKATPHRELPRHTLK